MKQFITILALGIAASSAASPSGPARSASLENLRIKGILMYDNDKNVENFGLYEYTVTPEVTRRMLTPIRAVSANGGIYIVKAGTRTAKVPL